MNKFEQLIEYVINDDEAKARELFHDIVVEKSRAIYEEMMQEEDEIEEGMDAELDDEVEEVEEGMMGGDQADDLIDDIEVEEEGISMEGDDDMDSEDHHDDMGGDEELEDRVVDLEDKLDELMAEFESLMGGDDMGVTKKWTLKSATNSTLLTWTAKKLSTTNSKQKACTKTSV
jgi:hypothetical protein